LAKRFGPRQESPDCVGLISRLALREDCLAGVADGATRHVEGEFATASAFKQVSRDGDLMVCRSGVTKEPIGFYEDVRHRL